jgi:hypothetical protein
MNLPGYGYHSGKARAVRGAALELEPYNMRVDAIARGSFATNIANVRIRTREGAVMF